MQLFIAEWGFTFYRDFNKVTCQGAKPTVAMKVKALQHFRKHFNITENTTTIKKTQ